MTGAEAWTAAGLLALGALHGINPAMGWLFAVALGLQEGRGSAVWRALGPLAAGHALAVGTVVAVALLLGRLVPLDFLAWGLAAVLVVMGVRRLVRPRHPRYGGMKVGPGQLTVWSFLMATAHGAGLMVVPLLLPSVPPPGGAAAAHAHGTLLAGLGGTGLATIVATVIHTGGYLLVAGLVAAVVYRSVGLRWLRTRWFNLDLVWGAALVLTGIATPFLT